MVNESITPGQATSGRAWREKSRTGVLLSLPSGNVVRLRKLAPIDFVTSGAIPDSLTPIVEAAMRNEDQAARKVTLDLKELGPFVDRICRGAFLEPRIVDDPQGDDEIALADVDGDDKLAVFNFVFGIQEAVTPFLARQAGDVAAVRDGEDVRAEAE